MALPKKSSPAIYKVVLIGESDVGKSSMFVRFRDGKFVETIQSTIGLDLVVRELLFTRPDNSKGSAQIQLWDTAGLERTGSMTNSYYMNSKAVVFMYDVTDASTLNRLQNWYDNASQYCVKEQGGSAKYFLVGNKIDLSSEIEVSKDVAQGFAAGLDIPKNHVFRVSLKTSKGLEKFLNDIALILTETMEPVQQQNIIFVGDDEESSHKCPKC